MRKVGVVARIAEPGQQPIAGSNIGRTSHSPSNSGQCLRCSSMNSVASWIAWAFELASKIAQPPMTCLVSVNGPSVMVSLPRWSRTRMLSLLGSSPPVSTREPFVRELSIDVPIASISAAGGEALRYFSELRMNDRYDMAYPLGTTQPTNEPKPDRHGR